MEASVDFDRLQDVNKSTLETHLRWSTIGSHAYEARDLPDTFPLSEQPSFFLYGLVLMVFCWWMMLKPLPRSTKTNKSVFPWGLDRLCMINLCYSWCWSWNTNTNLGHLLLMHGNNVLLLCCKGFVWYSYILRWKGSTRCMCSSSLFFNNCIANKFQQNEF